MKYLLLLAFAIAAVTGITLQRSELERNRKRDRNEDEQWRVLDLLASQLLLNISNDYRTIMAVDGIVTLLSERGTNTITIYIATNSIDAKPAPAPRRLRVAGPTL